jgi:dTDP-glucose 4,6-dehydratase
MKTILVTGGCGFIGSHFVESLVGEGYRVINLDALTYAGDEINLQSVVGHPGYTFVKGDIGDRELVARLLDRHRPAMVFNLAAESHVDRSIDDAAPFLRTNIIAVQSLLEACLVHWRAAGDRSTEFLFVQMSTDEVYGSIEQGLFTEDSNYAPNSPYAASKAAGDHLVRSYRVTFGLPTAVVHASNTYGPRQFPEKLIPHMISSALEGKPLPVYGEGRQVRDWMFVGDVARGLMQVVRHGRAGGIYNFAGGHERMNLDTVKAICANLDRLVPRNSEYSTAIAYVADRPGHDMRYAMSSAEVERLFGWKPMTDFHNGLEMTVRWYLDNADWVRRLKARGYAGERLGRGT